jgi:hypothetical protein
MMGSGGRSDVQPPVTVHGAWDTGLAATTRLLDGRNRNRRLRMINQNMGGKDFSAGRRMRGLSERSSESGRSGGRIGPEGTRASANTSGPDFMPGLGPMKLRIVKDTRTERRKPVSSAGPVLKEALPKCDPAV